MIALSRQQKIEKKEKELQRYIRGTMKDKKVTIKVLAKELGITPQGLGYQIENMTLKPITLITIFNYLDADFDELGERFKI